MTSIPRSARAACALVLTLALAAPAAAAQLSVQFRTMRGHLQNVTMSVGAQEAARLFSSPAALDAQLTKARAAYAEKLGYSAGVNGSDFHKIVPGLRVEKISLDGPGGRAEQLRGPDRERDDDQDFDVDHKKKRARGAGTTKSGNGKKW